MGEQIKREMKSSKNKGYIKTENAKYKYLTMKSNYDFIFFK